MDKLQVCLLLTGGLGLAVCLLLFSWARSVNRAVSLKSYRDGAPGFADLLNYGALIEPGILACKNGALMPPTSTPAKTIPASPTSNGI
jgi:hypothetical protein